MNAPIRLRAPGCTCDGSGWTGPDHHAMCPCFSEPLSDKVDRAEAELDRLRAENAELRTERQRLVDQRVALLEHIEERAAALQSALNLDGARALMTLVKEMADG